MLSTKMVNALNDQIKWELQSSYLYLGMAAYLNDAKFDGVAKWMRAQAREEVGHAMKFYDYIEERVLGKARRYLAPQDGNIVD